MTALQFLKKYGKEESERVAIEAGTNFVYFYQIARGFRRPSVNLAERLEVASKKKMKFEELLRAVKVAEAEYTQSMQAN